MRTKKPRRHKSSWNRQKRSVAKQCKESWSMDFMTDELFTGKSYRVLTLVDNVRRENLALRAGHRLTGDDLVQVLEAIRELRGVPKSIRVDNGPEFVSKSLDWWTYFNQVTLDFSRPGKPTDNAFIERERWGYLNRHGEQQSNHKPRERRVCWAEHRAVACLGTAAAGRVS